MSSFTHFSTLDFDQIKAQIRDYLRANSKFSDFDFEGSNFSILIDTLAYNTYINSFNANLVAKKPLHFDIQYALSNSFGFGGTNTALLFKSF